MRAMQYATTLTHQCINIGQQTGKSEKQRMGVDVAFGPNFRSKIGTVNDIWDILRETYTVQFVSI